MRLICIASSSKGNAYALEAENEILFLEAGCPIKDVKKAIHWQIGRVVGCILSHSHVDHIGKIRDYCSIGFPIYTNDETAEFIETVYGEKVHSMPEFQRCNLGGFTVQPFYLPHNGIPNFGYMIEHAEMGKMLFMTDMEYCRYDFNHFDINHLLVEANYDMELVDRSIPNYEHKLLGHCSIQTACGIIRANKTPELRSVTLCHLGQFSDANNFLVQAVGAAGVGVAVGIAKAGRVFDVGLMPF